MRELYPAASSGLPLYKEVKRQMVAALARSEWKPGEAIPPEKVLCTRFNVSIGTLRKAIDELVAENILVRQQGRGTFVTVHNHGPRLFRFFNYERHDGHRDAPELTLISFTEIKADKVVAAKLGLAIGAKVFNIISVRGFGDGPVLAEDIKLPRALFPRMTEDQLRTHHSPLYSQYQNEYGVNVVRIEEGVRATLASPEHAELLHVEPGAPLLQVHRVAYSFNDQPVEYRISHVNTEHHQYARSVT
ncbi:GntR family transcriptional regulator [Oxalobacteraceae bacterium CAVE-383]|nr:GntR family transcriptional regulator [Oxalobacteraceae bacterium CAVE-383]